jgi:arylsulfatase A-like enzyme
MTRRGFVQTSAAASAVQSTPQRRPNVLFLMADQLRYDCLGANGNALIKTPHLDRLAQGSANFSHCFVQAPVCVPSRISYFTGRYPHSHKNRVNYTPCDPREVLMQKRFQDAGYQTGSVGKLHLYPPTANHARSTGFDRVLLDDGVRATDRFSDYVPWRRGRDPLARQVEPRISPPARIRSAWRLMPNSRRPRGPADKLGRCYAISQHPRNHSSSMYRSSNRIRRTRCLRHLTPCTTMSRSRSPIR